MPIKSSFSGERSKQEIGLQSPINFSKEFEIESEESIQKIVSEIEYLSQHVFDIKIDSNVQFVFHLN